MTALPTAVMKEYKMRRYYETMHRNNYDRYEGNIRKKITETEIITLQREKFFVNIIQIDEDTIKRSFAIREMIAKSLQPFA